MKYYIVEIQNNNGTFAHIVHTADTRMEAESRYHQVLAAAAISSLTSHAAILFSHEGAPIMYQCYRHEAPAPEPEVEEPEELVEG